LAVVARIILVANRAVAAVLCFMCRLNRDNHALHPPAVVSAMTGQVEVSVALQVGGVTLA
jgi:hypothetical protein